ncbi:hypothetical protein BV898_04124 [Hypsibius exemplaris]|uniref:Uncharacterized protein n=1 Tax=Hypsibius exemplaris TaxID=2072580 RepID=A0A1W0X3A9_HYPEX|nr:hypothetical protein BV898_04124 [Hypsibius exemplaris]
MAHSFLEVAINPAIQREHLGNLVVGIIKQILFHRDQMPMPFEILDRHVKSGRSRTLNERLPALHSQLRDLFHSITQTFAGRNIYVDQVELLFGQNRFNVKEAHRICLPLLFPARKALADLFMRPDDLNSILRRLLEEDPFCKFPLGGPTYLHVFVHASPLDIGDPFLDFFEPMLRFSPDDSPSCPQSVFNLHYSNCRSSSSTMCPTSTVSRSASHWSVSQSDRRGRDLSEEDGVRKRLFDDSQLLNNSAVLSDPYQEETCEEDTSDAEFGEIDGEADSASGDVENVEISGGEACDASRFLWYRSKTVIAGWSPQSSNG